MTRNDAWKYARLQTRKRHTNKSLEEDMKAKGYTDEEIWMVKEWLFNYGRGFK